MAERFRADPEVAGQVARELAEVRSTMESLGRIFDGYEGATGSARIEKALEDFFADSSDNRKKMSDLLERGSGLLRGLAEGTTAVDTELADAMRPEYTPGQRAAADRVPAQPVPAAGDRR